MLKVNPTLVEDVFSTIKVIILRFLKLTSDSIGTYFKGIGMLAAQFCNSNMLFRVNSSESRKNHKAEQPTVNTGYHRRYAKLQ